MGNLQTVEFFGAHESQFQGRLFQAGSFRVGGANDPRGPVVTDHGRQRRHQHQRLIRQLRQSLPVQVQTGHTIHPEALAGVAEQLHGTEQVHDDDELEDIELKASELPFGGVVVSLLGVADRFVAVRGTLKSALAIVDRGDLLVEAAAAWATHGLSLVAIRSSNA